MSAPTLADTQQMGHGHPWAVWLMKNEELHVFHAYSAAEGFAKKQAVLGETCYILRLEAVVEAQAVLTKIPS